MGTSASKRPRDLREVFMPAAPITCGRVAPILGVALVVEDADARTLGKLLTELSSPEAPITHALGLLLSFDGYDDLRGQGRDGGW